MKARVVLPPFLDHTIRAGVRVPGASSPFRSVGAGPMSHLSIVSERFIGNRLVVMHQMPENRMSVFFKLLGEPRILLLFASERESGALVGSLCALVPLATVRQIFEEEGGLDRGEAYIPASDEAGSLELRAPVLLGELRRSVESREFPGNLTKEAESLLRSVVRGDVDDIVEGILNDI